MLIKLIWVGKMKDRALAAKCQELLDRLHKYAKVEVVELPDSTVVGEGKAMQRELAKERNARIFALSEEGKEYTTVQFADQMKHCDCKMIFIIGGPFGLAPEIRHGGYTLWSLSKLTFPHEIARLLLCEQLYRAANFINGGSYHHI